MAVVRCASCGGSVPAAALCSACSELLLGSAWRTIAQQIAQAADIYDGNDRGLVRGACTRIRSAASEHLPRRTSR